MSIPNVDPFTALPNTQNNGKPVNDVFVDLPTTQPEVNVVDVVVTEDTTLSTLSDSDLTAIAALSVIADNLRDLANTVDNVLAQVGKPANTNTVETSNNTSSMDDNTPKLSQLEASVLSILRKAKGKFVSTSTIRNRIPQRVLNKLPLNYYGGNTADVPAAVRRIRNKTGLTIQAALTTRRVTGEISKTERGYRLVTV